MTLTTITNGAFIKAGLIILFFIFLDLASKHLVVTYLDDTLKIIPGILSLEKVQNPGIALGMFARAGAVIPYLIPVGIGIVIYFFWNTPPGKSWEFHGYAFILGGAVGNYVDRLLTGTVTDFIRLDFLGRLFPYIFNVADIIICVGVGLIILQLILDIRRKTDAPGSS